MKRQWLAVLCVFMTCAAYASVTLHLEANTVPYGQPFRLTLSATESQGDGIPDLTPLRQDFRIVGTQRSQSYSSVNGNTQVFSQWSVLLMPKRVGMLTIPSLRYGNAYTAPRTIEVMDSGMGSAQQAVEGEPVLLNASVSTDAPYVNQQVIYTVKLYNNQQIYDADFREPHVENALWVPLGGGRRYQEEVKGVLYAVEEHPYALFPQKSGDLTLSSAQFQGLVAETIPKPVSLQTKPITLHVQPIPDGFEEGKWLPAKDVTLSETYERAPTLYPGDTLTRNITLKAIGTPAQLLPPLVLVAGEGMSVYPEKPNEQTDFIQGNLVGQTTWKVTYLVNQSGQLVIPALQVHWFNTQTGKAQTAALPERTVTVAHVEQQAKPHPPKNPSTNALAPQPTSSEPAPAGASLRMMAWGWWVAGGLALAWAITLILWYGSRSNLYSKKNILKALRRACRTHHPKAAEASLIAWANHQWPDLHIRQLSGIKKEWVNEAFANAIDTLSKALYAPKTVKPWDGSALWACVVSFKRKKTAKKTKADLPPLNPD